MKQSFQCYELQNGDIEKEKEKWKRHSQLCFFSTTAEFSCILSTCLELWYQMGQMSHFSQNTHNLVVFIPDIEANTLCLTPQPCQSPQPPSL